MSLDSTSSARLQVLASALLFSTGGAAIKAISLTPWQVAGLRCLVAAVALPLMIPAARRAISLRSALVGLAYAGALVSYVLANRLTTAASTVFLVSTSPLYILLLSPWLLKEKLRRQDLFFMMVLAAGLGLLLFDTQEPLATAPDPVLGNWLGALGGFCFALALVGLRWLGRGSSDRVDAVGAVLCGNLIAFLVCLPWAVPIGSVSLRDGAIVGFLGVFQVALAYALLTAGLRHLGAAEVSLLLFVEPVLNPLWAWWLHAEAPGKWTLLGGAVVLLATGAKVWLDRPARPGPA